MPSTYLTSMAPKWAATANVTLYGRTVQFFPGTISGTTNVLNSSVVIAGTGTDYFGTPTTRKEIAVGDTIIVNVTGTTYESPRVVTVATSGVAANVDYPFATSRNAQVLVRAQQFVVPGDMGWTKSKLLRGNVTTNGATQHLLGNLTAFTTDLKVGDIITVVGLAKHANTVTVTQVVNDTNVKVSTAMTLPNAHAVFKFEELLQTIPQLDEVQ